MMSNHLHVILRNRPDVLETWSEEEVARRWWQLFPQRRNAEGQAVAAQVTIDFWRCRRKRI